MQSHKFWQPWKNGNQVTTVAAATAMMHPCLVGWFGEILFQFTQTVPMTRSHSLVPCLKSKQPWSKTATIIGPSSRINNQSHLQYDIMDSYPMKIRRPDAHVNNNPNDCLHTCLPGDDLYSQLLTHMLQLKIDEHSDVASVQSRTIHMSWRWMVRKARRRIMHQRIASHSVLHFQQQNV